MSPRTLALMVALVVGLPTAAGLPLLGQNAQADASRWDASRWDGSRWDGATWDGSRWDASRWDASRWDGSRWDASRWDASRWDASRWDASRWDGYDPLYPYQWGHRASNAPGAWALVGPGDGSRVICVVDSGVDHTHPDLASQMWTNARGEHGFDFVDGDADPMDVGGHGTHVASIAAARSGDGTGMAGIANAKIMAVRVIGPDGTGTDAALASGITYCAMNGAHIVSLSLSLDARSKEVESAIKAAAKAGLLIVASAGNCGDCTTPLANVGQALSVTSLAPDGQKSSFAPWNGKTDLAAPGESIPGAIPGNAYALGTGSSQAVPHVAGAAVLVWAADPTLDAKDVAKILKSTASSLRDEATGAKMHVLDIEQAVLKALDQ